MTPPRPPLAGRSVIHAQMPEPWPEGRSKCDPLARRMRVPGGEPPMVRLLVQQSLALVPAPGRAVTCKRCFAVLAAAACRGIGEPTLPGSIPHLLRVGARIIDLDAGGRCGIVTRDDHENATWERPRIGVRYDDGEEADPVHPCHFRLVLDSAGQACAAAWLQERGRPAPSSAAALRRAVLRRAAGGR